MSRPAVIARHTMPRWRAGWGLALFLVLVLVVMSACSDEGRERVGDALDNVGTATPGDGGAAAPDEPAAPEAEAPAEPAPEPEAPAEPEPAPEPAEPATDAPAATDEGGLSSEDWILLGVLGLAVAGIAIGASAAATRRSEARAASRAELRRFLGDVVGQSRWIHDSGSIELLLATDPDQLTRTWNDLRIRIVNVEGLIASQAVGTGDQRLDQALDYLSQCLSDLRGAGEGYVTTQLRARGDQTQLTRTSNEAVAYRRELLQTAIEPVAAAMRY